MDVEISAQSAQCCSCEAAESLYGHLYAPLQISSSIVPDTGFLALGFNSCLDIKRLVHRDVRQLNASQLRPPWLHFMLIASGLESEQRQASHSNILQLLQPFQDSLL